ncbi:bacillithiol biosynthesis cysteine-adding enzyme BshC [Flammeovirga sp. MY04]|uniref:bacillithiol biosynthesis cysteine-adding enzyme BshC n=1 Tax=Flammeovirga sp. MY04 TaxID=1191459 RepID=UPI0008060CC0|nr:bacillithiol biosynthesis cysteine-adding enzyme BshC [Flammeovirga sp. MY04]ANQ47793.1 bacillithiol biosynthesis cysteine-adding enzyme BshC [Flammeovirga sp. MY04]
MNQYTIPFEKAGLYGKMFLDYLSGKDQLKTLYKHTPSIDAFDQIIESRQSFPQYKRDLLVDVLSDQYRNIEDAPVAQILKLGDKNTYTVVTGHQLNIFTGPLFFIYKIAATVNLCRQLAQKYPDLNFVPVYWMATEDHDFEEIASFNLGDKKYTWEHPQIGGPVGRLSLEGMDQIIDRIKDMPEVFKEAYTNFGNLADATRYYVNSLFKEYGLISIDADDVRLKTEFKEIIQQEIFDQKAVEEVEKANQLIIDNGYKPQIHARDINLFYMEDTERLRLEKVGDEFRTVDADYKWSATEMQQLIDASPEKFSPNVVLRPVLQEVLLPNLAYLGGPAEVIYWLQLKGTFDTYNVDFPMVLPRGFCLVMDDCCTVKWQKTGWSLEDVLKNERAIEDKILEEHQEVDTDISDQLAQINSLYNDILKKGVEITPNLEKHIIAEQKRVLKRVQHTQDKLKKEGRRKLKDESDRILKVRSFILPNNAPQERVKNIMEFWSIHQEVIGDSVKCLNPLSFNLNVLCDEC